MQNLRQKNYLKIIESSLGSKLFNHFYIRKNDETIDVLEGGLLSCAFFVSSIIKMFNLIESVHTTVNNTVEDMMRSGWLDIPIKEIKKGDVLVWDKKEFDDGSIHGHIGFYMGNNKAISHSCHKKTPVEHHFTFNNERLIVQALRFQDF